MENSIYAIPLAVLFAWAIHSTLEKKALLLKFSVWIVLLIVAIPLGGFLAEMLSHLFDFILPLIKFF